MTGGQLTKYQALLLDSSDTVLQTYQTLNPAYLMPGPDHASIVCEHGCKEVIELVYSSYLDLRDQVIDNATNSWFIDGSRFFCLFVF